VAYTDAIRESLAAARDVSDPRTYLRTARERISAVVAELLQVISRPT
jgi:fructose/tagatose bisphosphate aldolase